LRRQSRVCLSAVSRLVAVPRHSLPTERLLGRSETALGRRQRSSRQHASPRWRGTHGTSPASDSPCSSTAAPNAIAQRHPAGAGLLHVWCFALGRSGTPRRTARSSCGRRSRRSSGAKTASSILPTKSCSATAASRRSCRLGLGEHCSACTVAIVPRTAAIRLL
jgi:hypothetical protein